jgi:hypothetical protein
MNYNFYENIKQIKSHNPNYDVHKISLPFRMLICTASGGGKTNFLLNLIYEMNNTFHKIIIITKEEEPLYTHLQDKLKCVEIYYSGNVPEFEKMDKGNNGLVVFDDMLLTRNDKIGEMFIRGRKLGYSSIYITQSFFGSPKLIRQNVNYIALGRGMIKRDLRLVLSEFSINLTIDELENIYNEITKTPMQFLLIDTQKRNIRYNIKQIIYEY